MSELLNFYINLFVSVVSLKCKYVVSSSINLRFLFILLTFISSKCNEHWSPKRILNNNSTLIHQRLSWGIFFLLSHRAEIKALRNTWLKMHARFDGIFLYQMNAISHGSFMLWKRIPYLFCRLIPNEKKKFNMELVIRTNEYNSQFLNAFWKSDFLHLSLQKYYSNL